MQELLGVLLLYWVSGIVHIASFTGAEGHLAGAFCEAFCGGAHCNCKTSVATHILAPQQKVNLEMPVPTTKAFCPCRSIMSLATVERKVWELPGPATRRSHKMIWGKNVVVLFISDVKRQITDLAAHHGEHSLTWGEFSDFQLSCVLHPREGQSAAETAWQLQLVLSIQSTDRSC